MLRPGRPDHAVPTAFPSTRNSITCNPTAASYTTSFTNPGDISITGLYALYRRPGQQIHLNLGLNIPVGFMDYLNVQPSPVVPNLPYVIRTSSGSYGLLPGLTYRGQNELWTQSAQATGTVPFGLNRLNYELGNSADVTAWLSRRWDSHAGPPRRASTPSSGVTCAAPTAT